jgi:CBS-domain-containing membrane protein
MRELWDHDIGALPVVDEAGLPIAMITDRDVAVAAYTQGQPPHQIRVHSAMSKAAFTTRIGDSLADAERLMRNHQVRRLPVVDESSRLVGVLSWSDVALAHGGANSSGGRSGAGSALLQTLAAIATPQGSLTLHENDAAADATSAPARGEPPRAQVEQPAKKESGAARVRRTRKK